MISPSLGSLTYEMGSIAVPSTLHSTVARVKLLRVAMLPELQSVTKCVLGFFSFLLLFISQEHYSHKKGNIEDIKKRPGLSLCSPMQLLFPGILYSLSVLIHIKTIKWWWWAETLLPLDCSLPFCSPAYGGREQNPPLGGCWMNDLSLNILKEFRRFMQHEQVDAEKT